MSNVSLDQILQITTPAVNDRQTSLDKGQSGDNFRAHLDRAAEAADTKAQQAQEESEAASPEDDEPLSVESGQQDTTTSENETAPDSESGELSSAEQPSDDSPSDATNPEDQVLLSAAAILQAVDESSDLPPQLIVAAGAELTTQGGTTNGQDQPAQGQRLTQQVLNNSLDTEAIDSQHDTSVTTVQTEPTSSSTTEIVETPLSSDQASQEVSGQIIATPTTNATHEPQKKKQTPNTGTLSAETDATESTSEHGEPSSEAEKTTATPITTSKPAPTIIQSADLPGTAETELATTGTHLSSDSHTTAPANVQSSSASELIASVEKSTNSFTASRNDGSAQAPNDTPAVDRVRFVQRVGGAIRSAQQRDGQIQLRLSPPELGTLKIQLTVNEGAITANLETESSAARSVLLDNLPALRERLAEQGISIEKFDVDVGREGQQQADDAADGDRDTNQKPSESESTQEATSREAVAAATATTTSNITNETGLDVEV